MKSKKNTTKSARKSATSVASEIDELSNELEDTSTKKTSESMEDDASPAEDRKQDNHQASDIKAEPLSELQTALSDAKEMRLLAQRKQAEFENFRKREDRIRSETFKYAARETVEELLPVLDDFERALEATSKLVPGEAEAQLLSGFELIYLKLRDILLRQGLSEVEIKKGELFDPHVHEAVGRVQTTELPEGTIIEVFEKGYRFKDRLLRPPKVTVSHSE